MIHILTRYRDWLLAELPMAPWAKWRPWLIEYGLFWVLGPVGIQHWWRKNFRKAIGYLLLWAMILGGGYFFLFQRKEGISFLVLWTGIFLLTISWVVDGCYLAWVRPQKIGLGLPAWLRLGVGCLWVLVMEVGLSLLILQPEVQQGLSGFLESL